MKNWVFIIICHLKKSIHVQLMIIINKYNLQNPKAIIYTLKEFTWRTFSQHLGSVVIITFPSISADNRE